MLGPDRRHHPHEQREVGASRRRRPSTAISIDAGTALAAPEPGGQRRFAVGHVDVGLDDGVVVERVVVDDEAVVLHEDARSRSSRVPVAKSTPSSPAARVTRAVRSKLRPPIAADAWPGSGDIGGRYT